MKFKNHNKHAVQLIGQNKVIVIIKPNQIAELPQYFQKYCPKHLRVVSVSVNKTRKVVKFNKKLPTTSNVRNILIPKKKKSKARIKSVQKIDFKTPKIRNINGTIGVGILSYNRTNSVKRLLESIKKFTNTNVPIYVSDESSDSATKKYLDDVKWINMLDNDDRLGVAGNTNRLMEKLSEFDYKIILNDDVEIINDGWELVYPNAMEDLGMHHFSYQQIGLFPSLKMQYKTTNINNYTLLTIDKKPQGAVISYDKTAFKKVGYFDVSFGLYGIEHVDWSNRVSISGIQQPGFHDVAHGKNYFKTHNDQSAVKLKTKYLSEAKNKYKTINNNSRIFIDRKK